MLHPAEHERQMGAASEDTRGFAGGLEIFREEKKRDAVMRTGRGFVEKKEGAMRKTAYSSESEDKHREFEENGEICK